MKFNRNRITITKIIVKFNRDDNDKSTFFCVENHTFFKRKK